MRGELLKARQKREWAAMDSLFHIGQGAFKEELQRFPNGGSPAEIQARIEELVVIKAAFKAIKREAQARKENSCAKNGADWRTLRTFHQILSSSIDST